MKPRSKEDRPAATAEAGTNAGNAKSASLPAPDGNGGDISGTGDKASVQREKPNSALKTVETNHPEEIAKIKKQYLDGDIKTEYEYGQALAEQQDRYGSERKKKIQELPGTVLTGSAVRIEAAKQTAAIDQKNCGRQIDRASKLKKYCLTPIRPKPKTGL